MHAKVYLRLCVCVCVPCVQYGKGKDAYGSKLNPVMLDVEGKAGSTISSNPLYWQHTEETQQFEKVGYREHIVDSA